MPVKGNRPVAEHLMIFLQQHEGVGFYILKLQREMAKQGWRHTGSAIYDNCQILFQQGFIVCREQHYGIAKDGRMMIPGLSKPKKPRLILPKLSPLEHERCDRCGKKFESNNEIHKRKFSNMAEPVYLCGDC